MKTIFILLLLNLFTSGVLAKNSFKKIIFKDKAIIAINQKTYFLTELNKILLALKYTKCFQTNYLKKFLNISNLVLDSYQEIKLNDLLSINTKSRIKTLTMFAKLEHFSKGKNIYNEYKSYYKNRKCQYPFNLMVKRIMFLEMYLGDRFNVLDDRSISSFKETILSMINIKNYD